MSVNDIKVKISALTNGFDQAITKVESSLSKLKKTGDGVGSTAARWGDRFTAAGKALMPASIAAGALTGATVKLGSEYQAQMGKVQAISGATAGEMSKLKTAAMNATKGTKFSAIEAGQAYEYMGMAGWKSAQMMDGLPAILNLATASGADLGTTSDIVTDALTAFGLQAKDTAMFADVLAAASTNSNTNVQMMGETFKYAAPIAGTLGYSVKDTAVAIGLMANAGIKGSQAGTTLRTALTNMAAPTGEMAKKMQELGIRTTDSNGKMLPLRDVIEQLRDKFKGLSKEQQAQAAETIFGKQAMSGMLAIINASEGDYNKLTKAIDNSNGAAEKMSKTMNDSQPIQTAIASIKDSFISIGETVMPIVAEVAKKVAELAQKFQSLPAPVKKGIAAFVGIVAISAPILLFVGKLFSGFAMLQVMSTTLGVSVLSLVAPFLAVVGAIAAVIAIGIVICKNWDKIKAKAKEIAKGIQDAWNGLGEFFKKLWDGIKQGFSDFFSSIGSGFSNAWNGVKTGLSEFGNSIVEFFTNMPGRISGALTGLVTSIGEWVSSMGTKAQEFGTTFIDTIVNFFTDLPYKIGYAIGATVGTIASGIANMYNTVKSEVPKIIDSIVTFFSELPGKIGDFFVKSWDKTKEWTSNMINSAKDLGTKFIENIVNFFSQLPGKVSTFINDTLNKIQTWGTNMGNAARETGRRFLDSVISFFSRLPGKVYNFLTSTINKVRTWATDMGRKGTEGASKFFNNIVNGLARLPGRMLNIGRDIVTGIWNGISGAARWLYDQVADFASGILDGIKDTLRIGSPSKEAEKEIGRWIPPGISIGIMGNLDTIKNSLGDVSDLIIHGITGVDDISTKALNYQISDLDSDFNTASPQPVNFVLNLGWRKFKAFVNDISKVQDSEIELVEEYGI